MRAAFLVWMALVALLACAALLLARTPLAPALRAPGLALAAVALATGLAHERFFARPGSRARRALGLASAFAFPALLACALLPTAATRDVSFASGEVRLAGTLYVPEGPGPHPGAVLVHGSTRQTRDSLLGLYRSMARGLARRGVAALIYDKRGCGESSGDFESALFDELAADAAAALDCLAERAEIDAERVGLWGISQGGWVAPLAAQASGRARFLALVSAPFAPEGEQRLFEWARRLRRGGAPEEHVQAALGVQRAIWEYYATGEGWEAVSRAWEEARSAPWWPLVEGLERRGPPPPEEVRSAAGRWALRWHRTDRVRDPRETLRVLGLPVLAVHGGRDEIVPMPQSRERAAVLVGELGPPSRALVYPDAGHPLLELPWPRFPDGYLDATADWILAASAVRS